jgi:OmpA-OmpF porin, OOP family
MKKILLSIFCISLMGSTIAQNEYKKRPALGVHFTFTDFKTASDLRANGLSSVLNAKQWSKTTRMSPGLAISYIQGISNHLDFAGTLNGSFLNYPIANKPAFINNDLLLEGAATANVKLLTDKHMVSPFVTLGIGGSKYKNYWGAFVPAGLGLQVNFLDEAFILLNTQYRIPITENSTYHLYHSIGVAGNIGKKKAEPAAVVPELPVVPVIADRDGDGIADADDKCPDVKGVAALQGCPDTDGDGITDGDDACPTEAGLGKYKGCPIPDTDKDGINDENDKCVDVAGLARYQGCPIPDGDGDTVNDEEDKCPTEKGSVENNGCPVLADYAFNADNVQFLSGSAKLTPKAIAELNKGAAILIAHPSLLVAINGHTDNAGKPATNKILSQKRADAVKLYMVKKGISADRLTSTGFGQEEPIADNITKAGKAKNRRVEFKGNN